MRKSYAQALQAALVATIKTLRRGPVRPALLLGLLLGTVTLQAQTMLSIEGPTTGTWTAPTTGGPYFLRITAKGGDGGTGTSSGQVAKGGIGAVMSGIFEVPAGQTIRAISGARGANNSSAGNVDGGGGGGGGAGAVNATTNTFLLIAGGGNGGGVNSGGYSAQITAGDGSGGPSSGLSPGGGGGVNGPGGGGEGGGGGQVSMTGLSAGGSSSVAKGGSGMGGGGGASNDLSKDGGGGGGQTGGSRYVARSAYSLPGGLCQNNIRSTTSTMTPQDGYVMVELLSTQTYYKDNDGDGYGNPSDSKLGAAGCVPTGYAANNTDPNDADPAIVGPLISISGATISDWTAPSTGGPYFVRITAKGGDGGTGRWDGAVTNGGSGATLSGVFKVDAGQTIRAISGAKGTSSLFAPDNNAGGGGGGSGAVNASTGIFLLIAGGGNSGNQYAGKSALITARSGSGGGAPYVGGGGGGGGINGAGESAPGGSGGGGQVSMTGLSAGGTTIGGGGGAGGSGMGGGGGGASYFTWSGAGGGGQTGGSGQNGFPAYSLPGGDCQSNVTGSGTSSPQDGYVTVELLLTQTYYKDNDGDGYGNANETTLGPSGCAPSGYVADNTDFNDSDPAIHLPTLACPSDVKVDNDAGKCGAVVAYTVPAVPTTNRKTVTETFDFSGAIVQWTVPQGVSKLTVTAKGAEGATSTYSQYPGGKGASVKGDVTIAAGTVLKILVGGTPPNANGENGSGGGGSFVAAAGNTPLMVAGGGGGSGYSGTSGPNGYFPISVGAGNGGYVGSSGSTGGGGFYTDGVGDSYHSGGQSFVNGGAGGGGIGGFGGGGYGTNAEGGGGGGYNGGTGAVSFEYTGRGGSSFNSGTNQVNAGGVNSGNGQVIITYDLLPDLKVVQTSGLASGEEFPVGNTVNSFALVQNGTDTLARCSSTVIVEDKEAPVFTPPAAREVALGTSCAITIPDLTGGLTGTDNCGNVIFSQAPLAGTVVSTTHGQTIDVMITGTDAHNNKTTSSVHLTAVDKTAPAITCVPAQRFCYSAGGSYNVPALHASDNCGVASIGYVITGATTRSGTGTNAGNAFNAGTSTIAWTVTDVNGNQNTCSTTVTVNKQIAVTIPDVKVLSKGVDANTVYPGYAPAASITLTAAASGGGTFAYKWSTGATTKFITVSPAATATYSVTVTDGSQCAATVSKQVLVVSASCGGSKVNVCHKGGNTLCIDKGSVADHLNHGDGLGKCGSAGARTMNVSGNAVDEESLGTAAVYPNPTSGTFTLQLNNAQEGIAQVVLLDGKGSTVEQRKLTLTQGKQTLLFNLAGRTNGLYLVQLRSGNGVQTFKVFVQH